jgi:SagB-type dehydrogenase family enzyme
MCLRSGVITAIDANGEAALALGSRWGEHLGVLTPTETKVLRTLGSGVHTEAELRDALASGDADSTLLRRLHAGGWLTVRYGHQDRPLVTIRPLGPHREPRPAPLVSPRLSRFALLRRDGDALVLESPVARAVTQVHDRDVLTVIGRLVGPPAPLPPVGLPPGVVAEIVEELAWYGFVHEADEDTNPDLASQQWGAHELWFHARSRAGYHDQPCGGTFWAAERFAPLPARRHAWPGIVTRLPAPAAGSAIDRPLDEVLAARRTVRSQDGEHPLTVAQLGEFLYRSARVIRTGTDGKQEVSLRPAPSGGALHSLEIYPVVTNVAGLAAGMYHYDPFDHLLEPVPAEQSAVAHMLSQAGASVGTAVPPQVLLVLACRFGRVMWKYQGMGYALVLKEVGVLVQTMYLVATAMGLAPCALGVADSDVFAQATGLDRLTESSVGEFVLGSRPAS